MSILAARIHGENYLSQPAYHPVGTAETQHIMPASHVSYSNGQVLYGSLHPLVTADGAVVPAVAEVTYPSVVPAGRP